MAEAYINDMYLDELGDALPVYRSVRKALEKYELTDNKKVSFAHADDDGGENFERWAAGCRIPGMHAAKMVAKKYLDLYQILEQQKQTAQKKPEPEIESATSASQPTGQVSQTSQAETKDTSVKENEAPSINLSVASFPFDDNPTEDSVPPDTNDETKKTDEKTQPDSRTQVGSENPTQNSRANPFAPGSTKSPRSQADLKNLTGQADASLTETNLESTSQTSNLIDNTLETGKSETQTETEPLPKVTDYDFTQLFMSLNRISNRNQQSKVINRPEENSHQIDFSTEFLEIGLDYLIQQIGGGLAANLGDNISFKIQAESIMMYSLTALGAVDSSQWLLWCLRQAYRRANLNKKTRQNFLKHKTFKELLNDNNINSRIAPEIKWFLLLSTLTPKQPASDHDNRDQQVILARLEQQDQQLTFIKALVTGLLNLDVSEDELREVLFGEQTRHVANALEDRFDDLVKPYRTRQRTKRSQQRFNRR